MGCKKFQSTLPIQGETGTSWANPIYSIAFQSTLPIQGETKIVGKNIGTTVISIHSPYTGRDIDGVVEKFNSIVFQSTLPIQGETYCSSHTCSSFHFNPLSLYRERRTR